jgi:long-chain acyl-CoA synthetase
MSNTEQKPWLKHYDRGVPQYIDYPEISLPELLRITATEHPERNCIIHGDRKITYADVESACSILAIRLMEYGISKGDRVGIIFGNNPEFVISFFAILNAGAVVVAINPYYKIPEIQYIVDDSEIKTILTGFSQETLVRNLQQYMQNIQILQLQSTDLEKISDSNSPAFQLLQGVGKNAQDENKKYSLPEVKQDDPAVFQYSGGTTGTPKAAVGMHRNLVANVHQFSEWLKGIEKPHPIFLSAIPFYHVYGMVLAMCLPIHLGATMITVEKLQPSEELINNIIRYQPDVFPCVPNLFSTIMKSPQFMDLKKGDLSICISGSAPLEDQVKKQFESKTGATILEGYGLSEAPTATHCNPLSGVKKMSSIGIPLPGVSAKIVDMECGDIELKTGEEGELIIRGPQVMREYHNRENETRISLRKGWLYTGDNARMDADGYFYITGRKKDLIKVSGFQVWPMEIEKVIRSYPGVQDVVVAGIYDETSGERPKAWIICKEGFNLDATKLRRFCKKQLADYKVPREFEVVGNFPRSQIGKVLRRELVRLDQEKKHPG